MTARGGHLIIGRTDEHGADPRFRLTRSGPVPMAFRSIDAGAGSRCRKEGTLQEVAESMREDLAAWAVDWS